MKTVGEFDESYDLVQLDYEVNELNRQYGEDFCYYLVRVADGDYEEIWGAYSPDVSAPAFRVK